MKDRPKQRISFRIVLPSTLAFLQESRKASGFSLFDLVHGYFYGRWTYFYIGFGTGSHPLARWYQKITRVFDHDKTQTPVLTKPEEKKGSIADGYHGKVVPLEAARKLVMVNEEIRLENLEKIIPYRRAKDIILKNPDHIAVLECPCRSARPDPCLPLDVCLIIGEPFASFVLEHHPRRSRRIGPQEAEAILRAEDERGHVHHAFFKDAMLGRFYAICNCCQCCCGAIQAHRNGTPMLASSGYRAEVDDQICSGCGECHQVCQFEALHFEDFSTIVDQAACMGCGICVSSCVNEAISLVRDPSKGEPLEITALMNAASD
jgi:NAD-dependent dihydropyrimidine dehydrogenase PreA subunit